MEENIIDKNQWQLGQYFAAAISCISPKGKYPGKPVFQIDNKNNSGYAESKEEVAVFEMKQRMNILNNTGLPESPM